MTGTELIAAERQRQIDVEGWTPEHDDEHESGELALAAVTYALPESLRDYRTFTEGRAHWKHPRFWPFEDFHPSPDDRVRELAKAGALIAAEIDRLQRSEG